MYDNPIYPTSLNTRTNTHTHVYVDVCARVCTHMCVDVLKFIQWTHARVTSRVAGVLLFKEQDCPQSATRKCAKKTHVKTMPILAFLYSSVSSS